MKIFSIVVAVIVTSLAGRLAAQETTGTISGRIVDAQQLVLPGVTVTATGPQGLKITVTDAEGRFTLAFLTPGSYAVRAELQGFTAIDRPDVQVGLGQAVDLALTMQVGGIEETIQVVSDAPTVDTSKTTVGASLDSAVLARLPVGRRFSDTLYLSR